LHGGKVANMDTERLLQSARKEWKRSLLDAAAKEVAPPGVQAQVLRALQEPGPALDNAAGSSSTAGVSAKLAALGSGVGVKLGLLFLVIAGASTAPFWLAPRAAPPPDVAVSQARTAPDAPPSPALGTRPPIPVEQPSPPSLATEAPEPKRLRQKARPARTADPLSVELQLLTAARSQLRAGDARAALLTLERYRHAFPAGVLRPEADQLSSQARERAHDMR